MNLLQLSAQRSLTCRDHFSQGEAGRQPHGYLTPKNITYPPLIHLDALMTGGHKYLIVTLTNVKDASKMNNQVVTLSCKGGDGHKHL